MRLLFEFLGHRLDITLEALLPDLEEETEEAEEPLETGELSALTEGSYLERSEPVPPPLGFAPAP